MRWVRSLAGGTADHHLRVLQGSRLAVAGSILLLAGAASADAAHTRLPSQGLRAQVGACLQGRGASTQPNPASDATLSALADLAQHRSFLLRFGDARVAVGVAPTAANARLLVELLREPRSQYVVRRAGVVVVLGKQGSGPAMRLVESCAPAAAAPSASAPRHRGRRVQTLPSGPKIYTVAGTGVSGNSGDEGPADQAQIDRARSIAPMPDGGYLFVEPFHNDVRRVWPDGSVTLFAGNGTAGGSGDGGSALAAELNVPHAVSLTTAGGVLIADGSNHRIREVLADGSIVTVAGTGAGGYSGDGGPATSAQINAPRGVVAVPGGGFLIPDSSNHRVRRVWPDGTITTVAGTGLQGFTGDGGPATSAELSIPFGVSPLPDGGFLVDDVGNQRIRRVWPNGTISTVAGTGVAGYSGDGGPATAAELYNPHNVWATRDGGFLIADCSNNAVRRVAPDGTISTLAGTGTAGYSGDGGAAGAAQLNCPKAVAELASGAVLVADTENNRIRYIGDPVAPAMLTPPVVSGSAMLGQTLRASSGSWSAIPAAAYAYQWQRCDGTGAACTDIPSATAPAYLLGPGDLGETVRVVVAPVNPGGSASSASAAAGPVASTSAVLPANTTPPTISGTLTAGSTLTAAPGVWTGSAPISYRFQWQRCNAAGTGCTAIGGATGATYTLAGADVGSTVRVDVSASNAATQAAYATAVASDSPRSFWRLDDATGALIDSKGFKDGAYVNGPTRAAPGLVASGSDTAVVLNGTSQYIDVPSDPAWTQGPFTIEIVVRADSPPVNRTIWSAIGAGFTGWWLNTGASGELRMFIGDGTGWRYVETTAVLDPGRTYDLAVSYDGSKARIYVDGALVSTGPAATLDPNTGSAPLRFGAYSTGPGQFWPGTLDEASFYSTALTAPQIASHHDASVASLPAARSAAAPVSAAPPPPPPPTTGGGGSGGGGGGLPPDLRVELSSNASLVPAVGSEVIFFATVSTTNAGASSRARLQLTLPAGYAVTRTYSDRGPGCSGSGSTLDCDVAWIAPGASTHVTVWGSVGQPGEQILSARASSLVELESNATLADNTATLTLLPSAAPATDKPAAILRALRLPSITGTLRVGRVVGVRPGAWQGVPTTITYQWELCTARGCRALPGANKTRLEVPASAGNRLRVVATARLGVRVARSVSAALVIHRR